MNIPFLDLKSQYAQIKNDVLPEINWVLDNTAYVMGKPVFQFEKDFAAVHNINHVIGTSAGTAGNHIALWALGIGPDDEVIIPANTFIATAWGATLCGAKPVFVDCHPDSYNIDSAKVEAAITSKTKAIVAVHLYGQSADMDALQQIAKKHNLFLVEDAAQAHLAEYKGKLVGGLADASSFSFYPGKNLGAYGEAGAVATNNDELAERMKMIRDHGAKDKYYHLIYGHNYRMEAIQGAVLGVKLKYLSQWTNGRRQVAAKYNDLLKDIPQIKLPVEMSYAKHVYHLFVIQVLNKKRDELQNFLKENGISTGLHYPVPLHLQPCFSNLGYKKGDFPVSEELTLQGLSLPMYPELKEEQQEYIALKIKEFFKNH